MSDEIACTIVWNRVTESLRDELVEMWLAENALPSRDDAEQRAEEAIVVARDASGHLVGVATARDIYAPRLVNHFLYYRTYVASDHRRQQVALALVEAAVDFFEAEFAARRTGKAIGLLAVTENTELQAGLRDAVTIIVPFVFVGVTDDGKQIRVHYFEGAQVA